MLHSAARLDDGRFVSPSTVPTLVLAALLNIGEVTGMFVATPDVSLTILVLDSVPRLIPRRMALVQTDLRNSCSLVTVCRLVSTVLSCLLSFPVV